MASLSAVSMATQMGQIRNTTPHSITSTFFSPLPIKQAQRASVMGQKPNIRAVRIQASLKEKAVTGLTAVALTAAMMVPADVAEAAELSPSLKNFLLSILSGGVVLVAILGAVIAVSNFDPVKRV